MSTPIGAYPKALCSYSLLSILYCALYWSDFSSWPAVRLPDPRLVRRPGRWRSPIPIRCSCLLIRPLRFSPPPTGLFAIDGARIISSWKGDHGPGRDLPRADRRPTLTSFPSTSTTARGGRVFPRLRQHLRMLSYISPHLAPHFQFIGSFRSLSLRPLPRLGAAFSFYLFPYCHLCAPYSPYYNSASLSVAFHPSGFLWLSVPYYVVE